MSKKCITHHACDCLMARIEKIERVFKQYQHLDKILSDERWLPSVDFKDQIVFDLWQAIRREETDNDEKS